MTYTFCRRSIPSLCTVCSYQSVSGGSEETIQKCHVQNSFYTVPTTSLYLTQGALTSTCGSNTYIHSVSFQNRSQQVETNIDGNGSCKVILIKPRVIGKLKRNLLMKHLVVFLVNILLSPYLDNYIKPTNKGSLEYNFTKGLQPPPGLPSTNIVPPPT